MTKHTHPEPLANGFSLGRFDANPHIATSENSDAFVIGVAYRDSTMEMPYECRKSRGHSWVVNGRKCQVDGERITWL